MLAVLAEAALRSFVLGSAVWIGLQLLRVRNPHLHMTSWLAVLVASLAMPLLMQWTRITISVPAPSVAPASLRPAEMALPDLLEPGIATAIPPGVAQAVDWSMVAMMVYAGVAGFLLLRLAVGLVLTWRLARSAAPLDSLADVRVSNSIGGPVTFGSTILVPPQFIEWDLPKRQAVLAHEGAHVVNRDFYALLLASLNRAVFWFSPFAWWQYTRLAELAEIISDSEAIEILDDKLSYAEILLELVQNGRPRPLALEMARACTVRARVERILEAAALAPTVSWRKRAWIAAAIAPAIIVSAGSIAYRSVPAAAQPVGGAAETASAPLKPEAIEYYAVGSSIFTISRESNGLYGQLTGQRKIRLAMAQDGNYSYPAATGPISFAPIDEPRPSRLKLLQNGQELQAARIAELPRAGGATDPALLDKYVGWYQLTQSRVLVVTRDGDRMLVRETGLPAIEIRPHGVDAFSSAQDDLLIFLCDNQAVVEKVLLHDPMSGARLARRIDADKAKTIEEQFARRMAEAPDRFREQIPAPGSKEAVLRGIADMQRGTPNYDRMSAALTAKIRRQASELHAMFIALGAVDSIFFRGVGPGGYDIYGAKFANGTAEFRILLAADGKAEDVLFRPDGDDTPGGVVPCSTEQGLKSRDGTAPIKLLLYNNSGEDIQLYNLDRNGTRTLHGTVGDNMSSSVTTYVGNPLIVAYRSGQCLDIVLPGQRTRYHTIEASRASGASERPASPRTTPLNGSEEMLRQYIEALGRGQPNYDRMTSEVAIQTRQQLALHQAILARLGPLRAMSFRTVSAMGSDVYMVHFVNGTAEWRIGLAKDGSIGRIALGPSY